MRRAFFDLRIALALAVTLNVLLAGIVAGNWLGRHHGPWSSCPEPQARDLSAPEFGPLRQRLASVAEQERDRRVELRRSRDELRALLRTDPLDPARLKQAFADLHEAESRARIGLYDGLADTLSRMPLEHRLLVVERLRITPRGRRGLFLDKHHRHRDRDDDHG